MPTSVLLVVSIVVAVYVVIVGAAAVGLARLRPSAPARSQPDASELHAPDAWPRVTVVVPARNEANRIGDCLDALLACDYPADRLELLVVDDFSTDATAARVRSRTPVRVGSEHSDHADIRLVAMSDVAASNGAAKPAAIARGVREATGDVVLTTDADCHVPPGWIQAMVQRCTPETPFVAGPVRFTHDERFFARLQALEFAGLVAFGAGSIGLGRPTYCNSANVAFRTDVLDALPDGSPFDAGRDPSDGIGAAGDEMLLQHVAYATDRDATFALDPDAVVTTLPEPDVDAYLRQRSRWASMGVRYPYVTPRLTVTALWLTHAVLLVTLLAAVALPAWRQPALLAWIAKMLADAALVAPFVRATNQRELLRSFVPAQGLILLFAPFAGLFGTFGSVEWKGRVVE